MQVSQTIFTLFIQISQIDKNGYISQVGPSYGIAALGTKNLKDVIINELFGNLNILKINSYIDGKEIEIYRDRVENALLQKFNISINKILRSILWAEISGHLSHAPEGISQKEYEIQKSLGTTKNISLTLLATVKSKQVSYV